MNPNNPTNSSRKSQAWFRLLSLTASRVGKLATCLLLLLGVAMLSQSARAQNYGTDAYSIAVLADNPVAFWQLNDDSGATIAADSSGHGYNATYGSGSLVGYMNGIVSPQPSDSWFPSTPPDEFYSGFTNLQGAVQCGAASSAVTISPLGLTPAALYPLGMLTTNADGTTNVDTSIVMWIKPTVTPAGNAGLLFDRGTGVAGLGFETANSGGSTELGFNWNGSWYTGGYWHSGLYPTVNAWSFVALVVVSNQATIYMYYVDTNTGTPKFPSSAQTGFTYSPVPWNEGTIELGGDSANGIFSGNISGAAVFNKALTGDQVLALFAAGVGTNGFAPQVTGQPQSAFIFAGTPQVSLSGTAVGTPALGYQWQLSGVNVTDGANYSGANSNTLTVLNATVAQSGAYRLIVTNMFGATTSSVALLNVQTPSLVGEWLTNGTLADLSGFTPGGIHDGYSVGGVNYSFSSDVPPGKSGQSLYLSAANTGIAISNSATVDGATYTNTFDNAINRTITVMCWAKGTIGTWLPWVSKYGENPGWQLRSGPNTGYACWTMRDNNAGAATLGSGGDDMYTTLFNTAGSAWHLYAGTFDAVTGIRNLYVDGQLAAQETNTVPYFLATAEHLCIGSRDSPPGNSFGGYISGGIYDVRIYNYALTAAQIGAVYGNQPAVVGVQPSSVSGWANVTAQMTATASGSLPLAYQWQLNGTNIQSLVDYTNFTGATSNILTILNTSTNDAGSYQLIVTNLYGTAASSNAVLSIVPKALVGEWFAGNADFTDVSGYTPGGIHDGYIVGGSTYSFSSDVPAYRTGQSLYLSGGNTAIAISNSASGDGATYTNTYDVSALTIAFWAKGWAGGGNWTDWASKGGDNGTGYEVGQEGWSRYYMTQFQGSDHGGISYTVGDGLWGNTIVEAPNYPDTVGFWHFYVVTFNAANRVRSMWYDGKLVADQHGGVMYNSAALFHLVIGATDGHATAGVPNTYDEFATSWIYDVRFYNYDITSNQVQQLFGIPAGTPPQITAQPPTNITTSVQGITIHIDAPNGGSAPVTNQWQVNGVNVVDGTLSDGAIIIGSKTAHLVIENVTTNEQGVYALVVGNPIATVVSTNVNLVVGTGYPAAAPAANLVGEWFAGSNTLADVSGYTPGGIHNGYPVGNSHYVWDTDVPPGKTGKSLYFNVGDTGIAILNSANVDGATYTNTFDEGLTNAFTVTVWAKGIMPGWNSWVSKRGDTTGWFIRINNNNMPTWDLPASSGLAANNNNVDAEWHQYTGVYDANASVTNVTSVTNIVVGPPDTTNVVYTTNVVVGIRRALYMDGVLLREANGTSAYPLAQAYHVVIGGEEGGWWGASAGSFSKWKVYDVRIYNAALTVNQINSTMVAAPSTPPSGPPTFSGGAPVVTTGPHGPQFVLTYSGTLLSATNVAGPFLPVAGATSPYTVIVSNAPDMFFKLSNP
jgi:hypothetical protein